MFHAGVENEIFGSVSVDALTVTAKTAAGKAASIAVFEQLAEINQMGVEKWKGIGYTGYKVGGIIWGQRIGTSILIGKGDDALTLYDAIEDVASLRDMKVTRIDVCADFKFDKAWPTYLREMHSDKRLQQVARRANREFKLVSSMSGDTLYFGKRTSPKFGRIYDKSDYYDLPRGSVYRFELETKKGIASETVKAVFGAVDGKRLSWGHSQHQIRRLIKGQFLKWGIYLDWMDIDVVVLRSEVRVTDVDRQLEWLQRCVAPTVEKLRFGGYEQQVFDALKIT